MLCARTYPGHAGQLLFSPVYPHPDSQNCAAGQACLAIHGAGIGDGDGGILYAFVLPSGTLGRR